jgi:hypothetical protein
VDHLVEIGLTTERQGDGFDVDQVGRHRLDQRAHRGDDRAQRRPEPLVVRMGQPAQHHHPGADGVDSWRKALVRQGLPRRKQRRGVAEDAAQLGGQVVGLAAGGGDHQ